jgi:hypothetical protein
MGMTLLCVSEDGTDGLRLFVSSEYSVHKERDTEGKVLPHQEWQHPDPTTLRYTEFGKLDCPQSFVGFLDAWLHLGVREFGGHVRLIRDGAAAIVSGREQSWEDKLDEDDARRQEMEAERERERLIEEQKRAPVYEWCTRCGAEREACKNPAHRGERRCMQCCGGVGDTNNRYCVNCLDLPYREKREKALGTAIVYTGESESDD